MDIIIRKEFDAEFTSNLVFENMAKYYQKHGLEWCQKKFINQAVDYDNYQVFFGSQVVGIFSLSSYMNLCLIRDIQIMSEYQRNGIGFDCLKFVQNYAIENGFTALGLKVFLENPAISLYKKFGFTIESEEGGIFKMIKKIPV